jgi:CRP/FNR family transcriptional regulator, cyclic AMP receptor protein
MAMVGPLRHAPPRASSFGTRLAADDWAALIGMGHPVRVTAGSRLVREGDPPGRVFVLVDGWVRVITTAVDGRESVLGLRGPGDLVGELAALRRTERAASVQALTAVDAVRLSAEETIELLQRHPTAGVAMMADLADRLVEAGRQLIARDAETTEERLIGLLRQLVAEAGRPVPGSTEIALELPLSQEDLGDLIGASRESVARALCRLRASGVLATRRRLIVILDPTALAGPV